MDALLEVGLSNAVAAAVLALLATLVGLLCRRPALAHALWLLVLLKLITPPLVRLPSPWPLAEPPVSRTHADSSPAPTVEPPGQPPLLTPEEALLAPEAWLIEELPVLEEAPLPAAPEVEPPHREGNQPEPISISGWSWTSVAGGLWLAGSLAWFALAGIRLARFQRALRCAVPAPARLQERTQALAGRLGLTRTPAVYVWPAPVAPLLWWMGGPARLILPADLVGRLSPAALDTLLLHELAHYRRRDHWVRALELVVLGLYWWHPAVWYARRELRECEEQCCDAWVVTALPGSARTYAEALLDTLDFLAGTRPAPLMTSGVGPVSDLKRRLTMILRGSTPRSLSWTASLGVFVLGLMLLPILPVWGQAEKKEDPKGLTIELTTDAEIELQRAAEDVKEQELKAVEADLQRKMAELQAARARLEKARATLKEGKAHAEVAKAAPVTIRIEISGVEAKPEEIKGLVQRLEKELPGKGHKVTVLTEGARALTAPPAKGQPEAGIELRFVKPVPAVEVKPGANNLYLSLQKKASSAAADTAKEQERLDALKKRMDYLMLERESVRQQEHLDALKKKMDLIREQEKARSAGAAAKPASSKGEERIGALEKKLDNVLRELDALRQQVKRGAPHTSPYAQPTPAHPERR